MIYLKELQRIRDTCEAELFVLDDRVIDETVKMLLDTVYTMIDQLALVAIAQEEKT